MEGAGEHLEDHPSEGRKYEEELETCRDHEAGIILDKKIEGLQGYPSTRGRDVLVRSVAICR